MIPALYIESDEDDGVDLTSKDAPAELLAEFEADWARQKALAIAHARADNPDRADEAEAQIAAAVDQIQAVARASIEKMIFRCLGGATH